MSNSCNDSLSDCKGVSEIRAPSPLPRAFLVITNYLLCKSQITIGTTGFDVIKDYRFSVAGRFGESYVPGYRRFKYLAAQEIAEVSHNLAGKIGSLVIHCQQKAFNRQIGIQAAPNADQG